MGDNFFSGIDIKLFDGDKPKKNADGLKVNADGSIDLHGKDAIKGIMGKGNVIIFTQVTDDAIALSWQANGELIKAIRQTGVSKYFSSLQPDEFNIVHKYINEYYDPNNPELNIENMRIALNDKSNNSDAMQERIDRAISEAEVACILNYEAVGIQTFAAPQLNSISSAKTLSDKAEKNKDEKTKDDYKKDRQEVKHDESLSKEEKEQMIEDINAQIKTAPKKNAQIMLQAMIGNAVLGALEKVSQDVAKDVMKKTLRSEKIVINCDLMQISELSGIPNSSFPDISKVDKFMEKRYGKKDVSTAVVLSSSNQAEFERKLLAGEINDPPEYMIITANAEFGKETIYSTKERLKYLKAQEILSDKSVETGYIAPEFGKAKNKEISIGG